MSKPKPKGIKWQNYVDGFNRNQLYKQKKKGNDPDDYPTVIDTTDLLRYLYRLFESVPKVAKRLGISDKTIYLKMKELGIDVNKQRKYSSKLDGKDVWSDHPLKVAKKYNVEVSTIYGHAERMGRPIKAGKTYKRKERDF